jgi:hypothetical protein
MDDYYPNWLGQDLINDNFDWQESLKTTMPLFLAEYTLHDSYWIGIYAQPDRKTTAAIRFDTYWSNGRIFFPGSSVADWPILLVRFPRAYSIYLNGLEEGETISGATSDRVDSMRLEQMPEHRILANPRPGIVKEYLLDEDLHRTVFEDIYGGQVDIWHSAEVNLLCFNRQKESLSIPDVARLT